MFKVLGAMILSVAVGFLLKDRLPLVKKSGAVIKYIVWLLLFLLGLSVGVNDVILGNLHTVGLKALALAAAGMLGAMLAARFVYDRFFAEKGERDER